MNRQDQKIKRALGGWPKLMEYLGKKKAEDTKVFFDPNQVVHRGEKPKSPCPTKRPPICPTPMEYKSTHNPDPSVPRYSFEVDPSENIGKTLTMESDPNSEPSTVSLKTFKESKTIRVLLETNVNWFKQRRPKGWTKQMHIDNPCVNCETELEKRMAINIANYLKEIK